MSHSTIYCRNGKRFKKCTIAAAQPIFLFIGKIKNWNLIFRKRFTGIRKIGRPRDALASHREAIKDNVPGTASLLASQFSSSYTLIHIKSLFATRTIIKVSITYFVLVVIFPTSKPKFRFAWSGKSCSKTSLSAHPWQSLIIVAGGIKSRLLF